MANSHLQPSMAAETQSMFSDLLAPTILYSTLSPSAPGMTLPAFETHGYVRNGSPTRLVYVNQPAASVTLAGGNGDYWVALHHDTHTPVASWTRQPGTHYLWQAAGTQPADPPGGLVMTRIVVAGGAITTGDGSLSHQYQKVAYGAQSGGLAFDKDLTYDQTNNILYARTLSSLDHPGDGRISFYTTMAAAGGTNRWAIYAGGNAPTHLGGALNVVGAVALGSTLGVSGTLTVVGSALLGTLQVSNGLGLGGAAQLGYGLYVHTGNTSLAANVSIGLAAEAITSVLDVNGSVRARGPLNTDSSVVVGGTFQSNAYAGFQGAPDNRFAMRVYGATYHDGAVGIQAVPAYPLDVSGQAYFHTQVGIGGPPNPSYSLVTSAGIYTGSIFYGAAEVNCLTLTVRSGTNFFGGGVGISWANEAGYWLTVPNIKTGSVDWSGTSNGAHLTLGGNLTAANVIATTTLYGVSASLSGGITWSTPSTGTFLTLTGNLNCANAIATNNLYGVTAVMSGELQAASCVLSSGQAYMVGGGPWLASSSRDLKEAITPIDDALGLLLAQRGRAYRWTEPRHAACLPGVRYGFVEDEVTLEQWRFPRPDGRVAIGAQGFEALCTEALRAIVERLEAIERTHHAERGD